MQYFQKVAQGVDVLPLAMALQRQPELFGRYVERKEAQGGPHGQMTDIWIRHNDRRPFVSGERPWSEFNDPHDPVWYPESDKLPQVRPLIFGVMNLVQGERLGGVLITKLPPGGEITPHIDPGWHAGYYDKYLISLQSEEGVSFAFQKTPDNFEVMRARTGDVHWFRNDITHAVRNQSTDDRIVMIISIRHAKGAAWAM